MKVLPKFKDNWQKEFQIAVSNNQELLNAFSVNQQGDIWISWGKWNKIKAEMYLKKIVGWNIHEGLWIRTYALNKGNNYNSKIIQQINHVEFQNLQSLGLTANSIESIESLCKIRMPKLKLLRIDQNFITNFRALRKMDVPQIKRISIDNNIGAQGWQYLSQIESCNLEWIDIEGFPDDSNQMMSVQNVGKLQSRYLNKILMRSRNRITMNGRKLQAIKGKSFSNLEVYTKPL